MRKLLILLSLVLSISGCSKSEDYIRNRSVKLMSNTGSCSGEQVQAPSGVNYILTAGHCAGLAVKGSIQVQSEYGTTISRKIIAEDPNSDLLLLEGLPGLKGLKIAESSYQRQHVRTFSHGKGFPTYKTEGYLIGEIEVEAPLKMIVSAEDEAACSSPKNKIFDAFGMFRLCLLDSFEMATTALIVPGSSGGIAVDDRGDLIGVVSAGDPHFGYLVTLRDIKAFLHNY